MLPAATGCHIASHYLLIRFKNALPQVMLDKYLTVDFDVKCLMTDPITNEWIVFLPDMPHLTKKLSHLLSCHLQRLLNII
jgi:hypothetical protein